MAQRGEAWRQGEEAGMAGRQRSGARRGCRGGRWSKGRRSCHRGAGEGRRLGVCQTGEERSRDALVMSWGQHARAHIGGDDVYSCARGGCGGGGLACLRGGGRVHRRGGERTTGAGRSGGGEEGEAAMVGMRVWPPRAMEEPPVVVRT